MIEEMHSVERNSKKSRRVWIKDNEDKNKYPEGKTVEEMKSGKKRENLQQQSSEQPACNQHLNHSWLLTPSLLQEVNRSHSLCDRSSK